MNNDPILNQQDIPETDRPNVSPAVIKRLPRYFRYLRELLREGKMRISSGELSSMMNVTASQIRQDLNCFGGFGQQGYGYNVNYLYAKICEILGVGAGLNAVVIGIGDLGRALVRSSMFEKRGVDIIGLFDVNPDLIGKPFGSLEVSHMDSLQEFCENNRVDFAVLTVPKPVALDVVGELIRLNVRGLWNFTGVEMPFDDTSIIVENVHMGDSLMTLGYKLCADRQDAPKQD